MAANFLSYWKPDTAKRELARVPTLLDHAASEQYARVSPGDVLWIVTAWSGGRLRLLGPLVVGEIAGVRRARAVLRTADLWGATHHALAAPGTAQPLRDVDIGDLAAALRFESAGGRDRLTLRDGRVNANQLQTMRRLTRAAAALLRARWAAGRDLGDGVGLDDPALHVPGAGGGFGDAAANREVERAAVDAVTRHLAQGGWAVRSVETEGRGYDLHCTRGGAERHVEVKGTRGAEPTFMLTAGELARARVDPDFELVVVTNALSVQQRRLRQYAGAELDARFDLTPLQFRAVPRAQATKAP